MFPILVIAIGIAVLLVGKKLAVLGAAIGALLGLALLHLFNFSGDPLLMLLIPGLLAVIGFFVAGFAKGIVNLLILAMGALGGAVIVLNFFDLFSINNGMMDWLWALIGAVVGLILVRRFKDPAMLVLAGLLGGLLVTRGLTIWFPSVLQGAIGTLLVIVLAGASIAYQGGYLGKRGADASAPPPAGGTTPTAPDSPAPPPASS